MKITPMTGERKIVLPIRATMLLGYDMFDVMEQVGVPLGKVAVFAAIASPFTDASPRCRVHG